MPRTLDDALAVLEGRELAEIVEILRGRVAQKSPKMKLSGEQARDAALYTIDWISSVDSGRSLADTLPHSTIELARAVNERGVRPADSVDIAAYLLAFTKALRFGNLRRLDINHSHVIGRDWPDIDYTGESMTWQSQKKYWQPKGVIDFKKAEHIHAYFRGAHDLPHFARVYKPAGTMADLVWPAGKKTTD